MTTPNSKATSTGSSWAGDRETEGRSEAGQQREVHQVTHHSDTHDDHRRQQRTKSQRHHSDDHQHAGEFEQTQARVEVTELGNLSRDEARDVGADVRLVLEVRGVPIGELHLIVQARARRDVQIGDGDI